MDSPASYMLERTKQILHDLLNSPIREKNDEDSDSSESVARKRRKIMEAPTSEDEFDKSPLKTGISPDRKKKKTIDTGSSISSSKRKRKDSESPKQAKSPKAPSRYKTRSNGHRKLSYQDVPAFSSDSDFNPSDGSESEGYRGDTSDSDWTEQSQEAQRTDQSRQAQRLNDEPSITSKEITKEKTKKMSRLKVLSEEAQESDYISVYYVGPGPTT